MKIGLEIKGGDAYREAQAITQFMTQAMGVYCSFIPRSTSTEALGSDR